jgi:hypothetical protein
MSRLAIIAGLGDLPAAVAGALPDRPLICALDGFAPEGLAVDRVFRFERLVPFLRQLTDEGVDRVVFAGAMSRPRFDPALFDPATAQLVPQLLAAIAQGDDAMLRVAISLFEDAGLAVVGLTGIAPQLLVGPGLLGSVASGPQDEADAARGRLILEALAPVDVGQGCVVAGGLCLGIEVIFGTDALLADVAARRQGRGGVFIKRAKTGQDLRVDLPTIGPATVQAVIAAGLSGICVHEGRVVVLHRAQVVALADAAGLAIWAVP